MRVGAGYCCPFEPSQLAPCVWRPCWWVRPVWPNLSFVLVWRIGMDPDHFDALSRLLAPLQSRRTFGRLLGAGLLGSFGFVSLQSTAARRKKCKPRCPECQHCHRGKCQVVTDGTTCTDRGTCLGGGCCTGTDAVCNPGAANAYCCHGGTCLPTTTHGTLCCGPLTCPVGSKVECCPPGDNWQCCPEGSIDNCIGQGNVCCPVGSAADQCPGETPVCCPTGSGADCCATGQTCSPTGCVG
jgi:hypothetical protein